MSNSKGNGPSNVVESMVTRGFITRKELATRRKAFMDAGVPQYEVERRLEQSLLAASKAKGKASPMKASLKTDTFVPKLETNLSKKKNNPLVSEVNLHKDIISKNVRDQLNRRNESRIFMKQAFRENPKEFNAIAHALTSKTPEEKARKKEAKRERRKFMHQVTGAEEGSWWSSLLNLGADLVPKLLPMLIGMGDYSDADELPLKRGTMPQSNSLLAAATSGGNGYEPPFMHAKGDKVRIAHREYLGDVYSSTAAFTPVQFPINPGMEETFPWLAPVANQFTTFRLMGMVADFVSQGSEYANVAGLGYVALATQYNALAPAFTNKRELLNYEYADSVKPSKNMTHWIECKPNEIACDEKYVRAGSIPANADLRLYDHGTLYLVVGGNTAAGSIIGQLWMSYDIEFYFPKLAGSSAGVLNFYSAERNGVTSALPLGNAFVPSLRSTIDLSVNTVNIGFPANLRGVFLFSFCWQGSPSPGSTALSVTAFPTGGLTLLTVIQAAPVLGSVNYWCLVLATVDADGGGIIFAATATCLPAAPCGLQINCSQVPKANPSCAIFDKKGAEADERYDSFMKALCGVDDDPRADLDDTSKNFKCKAHDLRSTDKWVVSEDETFLYIDGLPDETSPHWSWSVKEPFVKKFLSKIEGVSDQEFDQICFDAIRKMREAALGVNIDVCLKRTYSGRNVSLLKNDPSILVVAKNGQRLTLAPVKYVLHDVFSRGFMDLSPEDFTRSVDMIFVIANGEASISKQKI